MAKGKNEKAEKTAKAEKTEKAEKPDKATKDGRAKDAKKSPRPAVASGRTTARTGGALPGPPPPAGDPGPGRDVPAVSKPAAQAPVVPAARTAPDGDADGPSRPNGSRPANGSRPTNGAAPDTRPAPRSATPTASAASASAVVAPAATSDRTTDRRSGLVDELTTLALVPVDAARRILPERRLPFYLGVGALAVVGIVEWPVVLAAGMAWEALRRRRS